MPFDELRPEIMRIVQQRIAGKRVRSLRHASAGHQHRAADSDDLLLEQQLNRQPRPEGRPPVAHRQVHAIGLEIRHAIGRENMQVEVRMARGEIRQARDQPFRGEGWRGADRQPHRLRLQLIRRPGDDVERAPDIGDIGPPLAGQRQHARQPLEEFHPELGLQPADLLGDRPLRDAKLLGGQPKVQMARRHLEHFQPIQRRKLSRCVTH
ncbi:hypothetical protein D9M72_485940 [compost metagenome]